MQIRKGCKYKYNPVPIDAFICPPYGARTGQLEKGDIVIVIAPPAGCGSKKTINCGHVYINKVIYGKEQFMGMISVNSLEKI